MCQISTLHLVVYFIAATKLVYILFSLETTGMPVTEWVLSCWLASLVRGGGGLSQHVLVVRSFALYSYITKFRLGREIHRLFPSIDGKYTGFSYF